MDDDDGHALLTRGAHDDDEEDTELQFQPHKQKKTTYNETLVGVYRYLSAPFFSNGRTPSFYFLL